MDDEFVDVVVDECKREDFGLFDAHLKNDESVKFKITAFGDPDPDWPMEYTIKDMKNIGGIIKIKKCSFSWRDKFTGDREDGSIGDFYKEVKEHCEDLYTVHVSQDDLAEAGILIENEEFKHKTAKKRRITVILLSLLVLAATFLPIFLARVLDEKTFQYVCWAVFGVVTLFVAGKEIGIKSFGDLFGYFVGSGVFAFFIGLILRNATIQLIVAAVGIIFALGNVIRSFRLIKKRYGC